MKNEAKVDDLLSEASKKNTEIEALNKSLLSKVNELEDSVATLSEKH